MPWFSESRCLFLARSKINHILASLGPPDSKCLSWTKNLPRNIILWALTQPKSVNGWGKMGVGLLKFVWGVREGSVHGIGPAVWFSNEVEADGEKGGEMSKKMCWSWNAIKTLTYHTAENTYQWRLDSVVLLVWLQKGRISRELGYLKGGVTEPNKVSCCPFVGWCCRWLVECGHVVWYMLCSWRENAGTWFRVSTFCSSNHVVLFAWCL